jgi:DNA excision repair protein ERCC-2
MDETGIIVMLGERFLEPNYQKVMPSDWFQDDAKELVSTQIISDIASFWNGNVNKTDMVSEIEA